MKWIMDQMDNEKFVVVSWIHSHVDGTACGFSSVDMHSQFRYEEAFQRVLGTVLEIDRQNQCKKHDFCRLTEKGREWLICVTSKATCTTFNIPVAMPKAISNHTRKKFKLLMHCHFKSQI